MQTPDVRLVTEAQLSVELDGAIILTAPLAVTGSRGDGTALANLLIALESAGIISNGTVA